MFLHPNSVKIDNYCILPEIWQPLDHASLTINISIMEEFIQDKQCTIIKNSKKEENSVFF